MRELVAAMLLLSIPAWLTHIIVCIETSQWLFLATGILFAPVGVVHGWGVWLGFF